MGSEISISIPRVCYRPGDAITVTYDMKKASYTKGSCWIGLIPSNITSDDEYVNDNHDVSYFHVYQHTGQGTLRTSTSGTYTIKCFANDNGGKILSHCCISLVIIGRDRPDISTGCSFIGLDSKIKANEEITVTYDLSNCSYSSGSCWIGLIPSHITSTSEITNDQHDVDYFHVSQNIGKGTLRTSRVGRYRIKCFANDNGGKLLYRDPNIITIEADDDEKKVDTELASIKSNPGKSRHNLYELAKKTYKAKGKPVVIDANNILSDIKRNASRYKHASLPLKLGRDKPFSQWNESEFKREFSRKFNIPIDCIRILSVRAGSQLIDMILETHSSGAKLLCPIECLAERISTDKAKKEMVEFGIFAMEFGIKTVPGWHKMQDKIIMNPRWNKTYGKGNVYWAGANTDGKSRGGEPYYCPVGWKRFSVQFKEKAWDFDNKFDNWPIAYHGTSFNCHMLIALSGLMVSNNGCGWGSAVYLSPSIKYVSHPMYAEPKKFSLKNAKRAGWGGGQIDEFRKYDGKWIQCALAVRVKPGSFKKKGQTMGNFGVYGQSGTFDGIPKKELEWIIPGTVGDIVGQDRIIIYGFMIRAIDEEPNWNTWYDDYDNQIS